MVINNHNQCSEIRQGNFWGLIFCRGSFYGFVGSPHAKRNVVNHLIFQSEFPVFPYKGSGTPDLWTLSFSSVMSCVRSPYCAYATAFSQVGLFLDKPFPRIPFEKPISSNCVINDKPLIRN